MYTVYILQCGDKSLYTGITTDIKRRFKEHQMGKGSHYTASRRVQKVLYTEEALTRSVALRREALIKKMKRSAKLLLIKTAKQKHPVD